MSDTEQETVQEPTGAPETPDEPETEQESTPEPDEAQEPAVDEDEEDAELDQVDEPQAGALDEKAAEKAINALVNEATRHANRVSQIMGEDAQILVPCELCAPNLPGFRFPVTPQPDVIDKVREAIGLGATRDYAKATHARECDDCRGHGFVLSGSKVQGMELVKCPRCSGNGYIQVGATTVQQMAPATNGSPAPQPVNVDEQPTLADPWGRDPTHPDFGVMPNLVEQRHAVQGAGV